MDKITIQHLSDNDLTGPSYLAVYKTLDSKLVYKTKTYKDVLECFNSFGKFEKDTIVTVLSHGHVDRGIAIDQPNSFVSWAELIYLISEKKSGDKKIIVNLLAVCNSYTIEKMASFCNHEIDEFWVANNLTISISKAIIARDLQNFNLFHSNLEDEEKGLYSIIKY